VPFITAWGKALRLALDGSEESGRWREALRATKAAWDAAYNRERESNLAAFSDRTVGSGAKLCKRPSCPKSLPLGAKGYCSPECRREAESASTAVASSVSETPIASAIEQTLLHDGAACASSIRA